MSYRQELFAKDFSKAEFAAFRAGYERVNEGRPIETSKISYAETDPHFRELVANADAATIAFVNDFLPHLGLFLHGPFPLPGNRVTTSLWDCRGKLGSYKASGVLAKIAGARVLDIGCNAGYDSFLISTYGAAAEVVGIEPHGFYHQACFLNAVYDIPGVSFRNLGWEDLEPRHFRGFDFVNCQGLIYHVKEPMLLIEKLAAIMRPGATLVMETHILSEPSNRAEFIEGPFWGDQTYWWIFGAECLVGMLRSCGFKEVSMALKAECNSRNPQDPKMTVEGHPAGARAWFIATRG